MSYFRPVRRILKRGVQSTAWPLGYSEGECAGFARSFYTMNDDRMSIQIYREKITESIDLSSPSFFDASVKTFYINFSLIVDVYKCQGIQVEVLCFCMHLYKKMCIYKHFNNMHTMNIINLKGGSGEPT